MNNLFLTLLSSADGNVSWTDILIWRRYNLEPLKHSRVLLSINILTTFKILNYKKILSFNKPVLERDIQISIKPKRLSYRYFVCQVGFDLSIFFFSIYDTNSTGNLQSRFS